MESIRYVGGYGRMSWVDAGRYAVAEPDPLAAAAAGIIGHMNADHGEAQVLYCRHLAGRPDTVAATMSAVDRYGFEMVAECPSGRAAVRLGFPEPVLDRRRGPPGHGGHGGRGPPSRPAVIEWLWRQIASASPYDLAVSVPYAVAFVLVGAEVAWIARRPGDRAPILRAAATATAMALGALVVGLLYTAALRSLWTPLTWDAAAAFWRRARRPGRGWPRSWRGISRGGRTT